MEVSKDIGFDIGFDTVETGFSVTPQVISPKMAQKLLTGNHSKNRKIKKQVVESYRRQMEKGLWCANNGEGIKISDTNKIIDGQHRLLAIIAYGKPVEILVFTGIPESSMGSIDDGMKRTLADAMTIYGKQMANPLYVNGALTCLISLYSCNLTGRHYSATTSARRNSTSETLQFFDLLPNFTTISQQFFTKFKYTKIARVMPIGLAVALYYLLHDYDEEVVYSIFKSYETGIPMDDLREESAIHHAYEKSRRLKELKIRIAPWEYIMSFLWVVGGVKSGKKRNSIPKLSWSYDDSNEVAAHMINKLSEIKI